MVSQIIKDTFENVYRDDFKDSDNYHRILFNPARAVQSRELTQLQTIIQRELERFGRNIFKEGAAVNPVANLSVDTTYNFVKLQGAPSLSSDLVGTIFTGQTSAVKGKILRVVNAEGSDPATIYVAYISGGNDGLDKKFSAGETITNGTETFTVQAINTGANPAIGFGTNVFVGEADIFTTGHFVFSQKQSLLLSKYTSTPTATVGFKVNEDIVTVSDTSTLYDNSTGVPNTTAPGADRYRIRLELANKDDVDSAQTFVYVADIVNGFIVEVNNGREEYNKILDLLAQRTYEESGNYTISPFYGTFFNDETDNTKLSLNITPGIAYVKGYRIDERARKLSVDKPTETQLIQNDTVAISYGNYINVTSALGIPDINTYEKLNLRNNATYASGSTIGTARIRAIETSGSNYRYHLFDIKMNTGQSFRDVRSIGTSATKNAQLVLENGVAVIKDVKTNTGLFPLSRIRPSTLTDHSYTAQRVFTGTFDGSGGDTITLTASGETWSSTSDYLIVNSSTGAYITPTFSAASNVLTITGGPASTAYTLYAIIFKGATSAGPRSKTLTTATVTVGTSTDADGRVYVPLSKADIYELEEVKLGSASGADIKSKFRLDRGARDNFYDMGKLYLNPGETTPSGNVYVKFKYFAHGTTGSYFDVTSYTGQVAYNEIPTHRQTNGELIFLSDVIDFRPRINDAGTGFTGTGAVVNEYPQSTDLIQADISYYLPRKDVLIVSSTEGVKYKTGTPSFNPKAPDISQDEMLVQTFSLNPNTLNKNDLTSKFTNNRRYTMRDIGKIEDRIARVEEVATLSLLDLQASTLEVLDDAGLTRTKSGFVTDDFRDHRISDIKNEEHRAAIWPQGGEMTCSYRTKNVGLIYDSSQSTSIAQKGNLLMLNYTEEVYMSQPDATRTINLQPFAVINYEGNIILSPSSDEWKDEITNTTTIETNVVIDANGREVSRTSSQSTSTTTN